MSYRVRSTDVWYNMPGVVAAYQPGACPGGPLLARVNVGNEQRTPGRYMAAPGVAPTHDPRVGWTFNGTDQYLTTGVTPVNDQTFSMLVRFSDLTGGFVAVAGASSTAGASSPFFILQPARSSNVGYGNGTLDTSITTRYFSGVAGIAGNRAYRNGADEGITLASAAGTIGSIYIGAYNSGFTGTGFSSSKIQAVAIYNTTLTATQVWQASRQVAYCDRNPDWSAWGRRRRYYYAPSVAAALIYARRATALRTGSRGAIDG